MSSELPGSFPSEDVVLKQTEGGSAYAPTSSTTAAGQSTETGTYTASTEAANSNPTNPSGITEDVKRFAAEAMTAATAVGLAAKDAALAAKDAAMPVARDAAVAARDAAVPAANAASETVSNAAGYTRDSAVDLAGTARANAPSIIPGTGNNATPTHNTNTGFSSDETSSGIPTEVRDSIVKSGQAPEAAGDRQAVQDKSRMEHELLASVTTSQAGPGNATRNPFSTTQASTGTQAFGASSGIGSEANRPGLYSQDTGSYQTPGTAVVLGTDTERAFPLGGHSDPTSTSVPAFNETPAVTTGLESRQATDASTGTGRGFDYAHDAGATSRTEDAGSGFGSEERNPTSSSVAPIHDDVPASDVSTSGQEEPIQDKVPVRKSEEPTVGSGPGAYQTLSSGTPSGVRA
ncbi:hypothetical protein VM1G_04892 [Cytospora mali]|uniref:Uncharacterized protein n=1 Tax=Cytospora mali TaxID=578113 RepID=A0A194W203_CYTMA|nr:hypothetical protein VM1G_04892 [Valsa mali]